MLANALVAISLAIATSQADTPPSPDDFKAYDKAKAQVGRDANAHIKLALWCEAHGLKAERLKHLTLAVLIEPTNTKARALMGLIAFGGRWERPEAVGKKIQADAEMANNLAEYNKRRERMPHSAEAHWKLALWCEENGLKPEAVAHLTTVIRLDPKRDAAWKRLGYKRDQGRWVTDAQLADERAQAQAQKQADIRWRQQLQTWSARLGHAKTKDEALKALANVTAPSAVPAIWTTFVTGRTPKAALAVQLYGQIDSPAASRALVLLALSASSDDVRRTAAETLRRRDPREFAGLLIAGIKEPIKYTVRPVAGPGSPGTLSIRGKKFDLQRQYTSSSLPDFQLDATDTISYDANGLPVLNRIAGMTSNTSMSLSSSNQAIQQNQASTHNNIANSQYMFADIYLGEKGKEIGRVFANYQPQSINQMIFRVPSVISLETAAMAEMYAISYGLPYDALNGPDITLNIASANISHIPVGQMAMEAQKSAIVAQQRLQNDVARIDQTNAETDRANAPLLSILKESTGQDYGADRSAWSKWLANAQGYAFISNQSESRPTILEEVATEAQPVPVAVDREIIGFQGISCFGAGTEVYTMTGRRKIESLRAGDRVLTWNTTTGSLAMQPILTVFHNPPSPTLKIELEDESIVTTPWHRFWVPSKGWVVARDLKSGDQIRTLDQAATIRSVEPMATQPVFNLEVAEDHDFLVGRQGALVHDNTVATAVSTPFDGLPKDSLTSQSR